jgi:hypothetical protein
MRTNFNDNTRLVLAALAVVLVLVIVGLVCLAFVPHHYTDRIQEKWVRFGAVSILVGYTAKAYWKLRRLWGFWAILLGFLVIHVFGVACVWMLAASSI